MYRRAGGWQGWRTRAEHGRHQRPVAAYVVKYFNDIYTHAGEITKVCRKRAKFAYVIGNSKVFDHRYRRRVMSR